MLLAPVIERIDRVLPRVLAVAATFIVVIAVGVGLATAYATSLRNEADRLVLEAAWWRPRIHRASLYVGPAIPLIVGILGYAVYGIGGALYSMALSVFALAFVDELDVSDGDLPTPTDNHDADDREAGVGPPSEPIGS